ASRVLLCAPGAASLGDRGGGDPDLTPMQLVADLPSGSLLPAGVPPRAAGPELVPGLSAEVISDAAGLAAIAAEWRALQALSGASAVFQSFAQVSAWARHFAGEKSGLALHVVVVREAGRAVLILPLAVSGVPLLRIARIAGDPVAQYSDAIAHPGCTPAAFEAALATLRQAGVDALILRGLRDDS